MPSVPRRFLARRMGAIAASMTALMLIVAPGAEADPVSIAAPVISGTLQVGQTLSVTNGQWSDSSSPILSYSYEWLRCTQSICLIIPGATSSTYTLQDADNGQSLDADVVATDAEGHTGAEAAPQTFTVGMGSGSAYSFSESVSGPGSISGAVSMEPDSNLACPGPCGSSYTAGTQVVLTASPAPGATFSGWSGACSGTAPTCLVTLGSDATVTATFAAPATPGTGVLPQGASAAPAPEASTNALTRSLAGAARLLAVHWARHHVQAAVRCEQARPCRLSLALLAPSTGRAVVAQRSVTVASGRDASVDLALNRRAARLLAAHGHLAVVAVLTLSGNGKALPLSQKRLTLT